MDWKRISLVSVVVAASLIARQTALLLASAEGPDQRVGRDGGELGRAAAVRGLERRGLRRGVRRLRNVSQRAGGEARRAGDRVERRSQSYAQMQSACARTGNCIATYLNERELRGGVRHLMLIPRDAAAMTQMSRCAAGAGVKVSTARIGAGVPARDDRRPSIRRAAGKSFVLSGRVADPRG